MISVVMPLFNKEAYVGEAIRSVMGQSFPNWELIVVNDGSTDDSGEIVGSFNDSRIRLVSQPHKGVSSARNKGIEEAKYSWVAFLDADDWWESEFLETMVECIGNFPNKSIFATGRNHVYSRRIERYTHSVLPNKGQTGIIDYIEVIGRGGLPPINSSNVVINKKVLKKTGGFNEKMSAHEDHDLWLRICADNELVFVNTALSNYRKTGMKKRRPFSSLEFRSYLKTIQYVYLSLNKERRRHLKRYCNRFIPWSFYKNRKRYTTVEKNGIIRQSEGVISLYVKWILWILYRF